MLLIVMALAAVAAAAVGIPTHNEPLLRVASAGGLATVVVVVASLPRPRWRWRGEPGGDADDQAAHSGPPEPEDPSSETGIGNEGVPVTRSEDLSAVATAGGLVAVMEGRRRYHRPKCRLVAEGAWELITEEEARAEGFSPCTRCRE